MVSYKNEPDSLPDSTEQLENLLLSEGVNVNSARFRRREAGALNQRRKHIEKRNQDRRDNQSAIARQARRFINAALDLVAVAFVTVVVSVGMVASLAFFGIAEFFAVLAGFSVLHPQLAPLYAFVNVLSYTVLLFVSEVIESRTGTEQLTAFSLRYVWQKLTYTLGLGVNWQPKYKHELSLARRSRRAVFWVGATVVIFSLLGRVAPLLDTGQAMTWAQFFALVGNGVMTVALLAGQHFQVHFIYQIFVRLTGGIDTSADFFDVYSLEEELERERVKFLQIEYRKARIQARKTQALPTPKASQMNQDTQPYQLPKMDED